MNLIPHCLRALLFAALALPGFLTAQTADFTKAKTEAEQAFAQGNFAVANRLYREVNVTNLPAADQRWVLFRRADTQWRAQAGSHTADSTPLDQAREELTRLVRDVSRADERDLVWVEIQESLGDFWWVRQDQRNWGMAWQYYQQALDWWAGSADLEVARERYLKIVWKATTPPGRESYYYYGSYGNMLPLNIIENALKIARTANEQAHAHYLLAMTLRNQGDWETRQRVPEEFEAALKSGKGTDWYDDALYFYGEWMTSSGRITLRSDGNWNQEPDYVRAVELFRRLVREFGKGETRYWEQAQNQIRNIADASLIVSVANIFLPGSEIQYQVNWRNVKRVDFNLYSVDLTRDVQLAGQDDRRNDWLQSIDLAGREKVKSWSHETKDKGEHKPGYESLRLDGKLPPGAYILEAKADGNSTRDLVLVSDASVVMKTSGTQALIYFCDAQNGAPIPNATVTLWERWHDGSHWQARKSEKTAGTNGLAVFDLKRSKNQSFELFAAARSEARQAFSPGNTSWYSRDSEPWRIYAFTDRPAYRPKESVQWKFIARRYNGSVYSTPSEQTIEFEITDPRGAKIKADKVRLNAFGSAWGSLDLTEQMPLGEYNVTFWNEGRKETIGNATLFRLEEYKLPEFKVTVQTPEENGHRKAYRLGEKVTASVQADYYFGGAVANATVEVLVYQNPYYQYWHRPREYGWFYEDMDSVNQRRWWGGRNGQIVKRETLKTDAFGKATITFDTPNNNGQDFEYRIVARVTDASRREITGSGTVRVTRQRYYVYPQPAHNLYRPQDKVTVDFQAQDANEQPMSIEGIVTVTHDFWYEIWIAPDGHEVKGEELRVLRNRSTIFPPAPKRPDEPGWRLKFRGYEHDEIVKRTVKTDDQGAAQFTFTPEREGYYRVSWFSEDILPKRPPQPIRAETTVWVANNNTSELGYRQGGVEIIVDKDTFRAGQTAPVMLSVPTNDRYVLFSVEGEDLYSYQLVHVTGTVKLVELPITEQHVPNIFLSAAMVSDRQIFTDTKQIIVPPTKNFLTINVKPDKAHYQPREEGAFTVTTRDAEGKPVSAEVALSLVDESVFYIQSDYAGDMRQFYYGTKRSQQVNSQSTFNQKNYIKLVEGENKQLMDDREAEIRSRRHAGRNEAAAYDEQNRNGAFDRFNLDVVDLKVGDALDKDAAAERFGGGRGSMRAMAFAAAPAPLSAAMPSGKATSELQLRKSEVEKAKQLGRDDGSPSNEPAVQVRSDFRSTILWQPNVVTDANGQTTVNVTYPDSLTGWKAVARATSTGNQFGIADSTTRTKQPLIVRLQTPRFFVVGDTLTLSAVVNNNTDKSLEVKVTLDVTNDLLSPAPDTDKKPVTIWKTVSLTVPANGEARADWIALVKQSGDLKLKTTARGGKYADAMEKSYTVYEHGIEKFLGKSGKARGNDITINLDLPAARKIDSTRLSVQVTASPAVTMLDALPYLINYPYGCTEQTMSRFLPAVITAKTLKDLGLQPEDVMGRVFGGIEQTTAAQTHRDGKRDLQKLDDMVKAGLERLYDFQHSDGGWGWWKQGDSDHWMTAYVVWGLSLAKQSGVEIKDNTLNRAAQYLDKTLIEEEESPDMQAWMLHALATYQSVQKGGKITKFQQKAFDNLWAHHPQLNAYTRALFALAAHQYGKETEAKQLVANLGNGVKRDDRPDTSILIQPGNTAKPDASVLGTAHWGEDGVYWRWSEGGVEATAWALRAMLAIDPKNPLVEPVTNWLIKNRRGAQWNNTRDTAMVVLAMNDYLRVSGELKPEPEYELFVNGHSVAKKQIHGADVLNAPSRFTVDPKWIKDGANEIRIKHRGEGALYFAAEATFFSLEEPVPVAGNELFVKRQYFKLTGKPTLLKGFVYDRVLMKDGDTIKSGERVETVLTIETKNNYEYLLFEDLKPAGFEAIEVRSGAELYAQELKSGAVERKHGAAAVPAKAADATPQTSGKRAVRKVALMPAGTTTVDSGDHTGRSRWVYQELRDRKVALFIDKLPEGVWELKYDLRAEVPGEFHALPVLGQAMYVPEIRANSVEQHVTVLDAK